MRPCLKPFALFGSAVFALIRVATGGVVGDIDLKSLCNQADLIATGEVIAMRPDGVPITIEIPGRAVEVTPMTVEFRVGSILKGQLTAERLVFKWWLPPLNTYQKIRSGQFGVFFFRITHDHYEILDLYHPFVRSVPGAPKTVGSDLDKLVSELAFTLASNDATGLFKRDACDALSSLQESSATEALSPCDGGVVY